MVYTIVFTVVTSGVYPSCDDTDTMACILLVMMYSNGSLQMTVVGVLRELETAFHSIVSYNR